jgi:hypothetical protein
MPNGLYDKHQFNDYFPDYSHFDENKTKRFCMIYVYDTLSFFLSHAFLWNQRII